MRNPFALNVSADRLHNEHYAERTRGREGTEFDTASAAARTHTIFIINEAVSKDKKVNLTSWDNLEEIHAHFDGTDVVWGDNGYKRTHHGKGYVFYKGVGLNKGLKLYYFTEEFGRKMGVLV